MQLSYNKIIKKATVSENDALHLQLRKEFAKEAARESADAEVQKILSATREKAAQILEQADEKAKQITEKAQQMYEGAHQEGFEKGYREGYDKAYRDAREKVDAEAINVRNSAWEMLRSAEAERKITLSEIEEEVLALSVQIAEKLVAKQLDIDRETVLSIVQEAVLLLSDRDSFIIVANPADVEIIRQNKHMFMKFLTEAAGLKIIGDPDIDPGGCRVKTERGQIDSTLESRWQILLQSLHAQAGDEDE
ncbi:flagellar assembly protein FliH [Desulfofarcimen acetoxidans DSM 771]|uniref:Flagellar assembly protein FliH n=1 Tax=Desulfofarcimen acetoxidans (strain ATCC 49208 / DSM 771 / KCTC 5769 / VKM B-1644 / 5575) TaxID=485916 RepID=C8W1F9_DESAS|nr:FliH/SctL family protein [Desulfofarcimen acetoxidans]ACV61604.1 flagellar assembly protein FliH [Desulfofarcimen acetoxidans DSM 771]